MSSRKNPAPSVVASDGFDESSEPAVNSVVSREEFDSVVARLAAAESAFDTLLKLVKHNVDACTLVMPLE